MRLQKPGYTYLQTLYAHELSTDIDPHAGKVLSCGFLALSRSNELVASIGDAATILEWIHDASFRLAPSPSSGLTEDGFTATYKSLRTDRDASASSALAAVKSHLAAGAAKTVTVCGHGLGGALATLLAVDVALNTPARTRWHTASAARAPGTAFCARVQRLRFRELSHRQPSGRRCPTFRLSHRYRTNT